MPADIDNIVSLKDLNIEEILAHIKSSSENPTHTHFHDGDLTGADLSGIRIVACAHFENCNFTNATFANNAAYHLTFSGGNFDDALFHNGTWRTADFHEDCSFKQTCFFQNGKEYMRFCFYGGDTSGLLTNIPSVIYPHQKASLELESNK